MGIVIESGFHLPSGKVIMWGPTAWATHYRSFVTAGSS